MSRKPAPKELLAKNLGDGESSNVSFQRTAEGIRACHYNSRRLLNETQQLIDAGLFASARFLFTSAKEELAKAYILVDICRLDVKMHKDAFGKLCGAFYSHISKHAYLAILNYTYLDEFDDVKRAWEAEVNEWWPSEPESEVPDLPHDTCFGREMPLYCDFVDQDQRWSVPENTDTFFFGPVHNSPPLDNPTAKLKELLLVWDETLILNARLPEVLKELHAVFRGHYINEKKSWTNLEKLYGRVSIELEQLGIMDQAHFEVSPLVKWPLYHLVRQG